MKVKLNDGGMVKIPVEFQRKLGMKVGDTVVMIVENGELRMFTRKRGLQNAREIYRKHAPMDRDLVSELIVEREVESQAE